MKVEINPEMEEVKKEIEFPCIMQSEDGFVILILDKSNGLILKRSNHYRELSVPTVVFNNNWNLSQFKPFK